MSVLGTQSCIWYAETPLGCREGVTHHIHFFQRVKQWCWCLGMAFSFPSQTVRMSTCCPNCGYHPVRLSTLRWVVRELIICSRIQVGREILDHLCGAERAPCVIIQESHTKVSALLQALGQIIFSTRILRILTQPNVGINGLTL